MLYMPDEIHQLEYDLGVIDKTLHDIDQLLT